MANAPAKKNTPPHKAQRSAGNSTMSPALALAMALGLRTVQGPVEHRKPVAVRRDLSPAPVKQASLLPDGGGHKKSSVNAAAVRLALGD